MSSRLQEATLLVERLEAIVHNPRTILDLENDGVRRRFREAGRKLSIAMETAGDTTHRIANTVSGHAGARAVSTACAASPFALDEHARPCEPWPVFLRIQPLGALEHHLKTHADLDCLPVHSRCKSPPRASE